MRTPACAALVAVLLTLTAASRAQRAQEPSGGDLVELDVLALDRDDVPVGDLTAADFQIKDDGRIVDIKTFDAMSGRNEANRPERHIVLLLDDSSVPMTGTAVVQAMAQVILSRAQPDDEVTVVRLNNDRDEPFGDLETAMMRITQYHAGAVPYQYVSTSERVLKVVASIARTLESVEHRRKLIVCIGGPRVCNVLEPQPRGYSLIWNPWVQALNVAARANVALYAVMPVPIGTPMMLNGGLAYATGGSGFANNGKFERFVDLMWREATDYYLLGYWPASGKRDLRSIDVKVTRKGVRVRARHAR